MFIILDGSDDNDLESVAEALGVDDVRGHAGDFYDYVTTLTDYLPNTGLDVVCFGSAATDTKLSIGQRRWATLWAMARGASLWHITQPEVEKQTQRTYANLLKDSPLYSGTLYPDEYTLKVIADNIRNVAQYSEAKVENIAAEFPSFLGDTIPSALLVGSNFTFYPDKDSAAEYLFASFDNARWRNSAFCLLEQDGARLKELQDLLSGTHIIALGREVSEKLNDLEVEHAAAPDPVETARLHPEHGSMYGMLLDNLLSSTDKVFALPLK